MGKPVCTVTGANGQLGRRVVELLRASDTLSVRAGSRTPADGMIAVDFDDDEDRLAAAMEGSDRLVLISTNAFLVPGQRKAHQARAVRAARKAGVGHIVYTSMPRPDAASPIPFAPDHRSTEEAIAESGIPATILRIGWYAELLIPALKRASMSGVWQTSAGDGRIAHVPRGDVARTVAAAAQLVPGGVHDVTGAVARSTAEIAALATAISGAAIDVVQVPDAQLHDTLVAQGSPPPLADVAVGFDRNTREGRIDMVTDTVERLTGAPPRALEDFLRETVPLWAR